MYLYLPTRAAQPDEYVDPGVPTDARIWRNYGPQLVCERRWDHAQRRGAVQVIHNYTSILNDSTPSNTRDGASHAACTHTH